MNELALHTVFTDEQQAVMTIKGTIAPYCKAQWKSGVDRLAVTVMPLEDSRTIQQNRFYWGIVLKEISEQARIAGQRYTLDAWHELFKRQELPRRTKKVYVAGKKRPVITTTIGTTTGLSVKKMTEYLEKVIAFSATDLNVRFSLHNWESFR